MRAESKFMKRLGAMALAAGIVFGALAANTHQVSAATKFQVADTKYEKSYKLDDGKVCFEAKGVFPVIKDNSKAAKKINQELKKAKNAWIKETKKEASDAKADFDFMLADDSVPMPEWVYSDDINYEVTSNDGKYFSVLMSGYDFRGGAHGSPYRVTMTFDAKTGQKLAAAKLFGTTKAKLNSKVRKLYLKKYDKEGVEGGFYDDDEYSGKSGRDILKETLATKDYNDTFYVKNGKAVFYANPYDLGPYAAGFIEVSATVK